MGKVLDNFTGDGRSDTFRYVESPGTESQPLIIFIKGMVGNDRVTLQQADPDGEDWLEVAWADNPMRDDGVYTVYTGPGLFSLLVDDRQGASTLNAWIFTDSNAYRELMKQVSEPVEP